MRIPLQENLPILLWALLCSACATLGQYSHKKPWPTYSLHNMPQTSFTCHDKILGGYYADSETQCQMFHVCVKVAGVGVQDFRFLCPNGTAFDQEAQICADWGDVDCEQAVLYYGSDNFDLYRLGSGFESKRAPLAEEEEAPFHLQRAESADIRRSKETRVDQHFRPDSDKFTKKLDSVTQNSILETNPTNRRNHEQGNEFSKATQKFDSTQKASPNHYAAAKNKQVFNNPETKHEIDDLFKGSHSSHFFANRNNGHEDDFYDQKPLSASTTSTSTTLKPYTTTSHIFNRNNQPSNVGFSEPKIKRPHRARRPTTSKPVTTTTSTTDTPRATKKASIHPSFNVGAKFVNDQFYKSVSTTTPSAPPSSTQRPDKSEKFSFGVHDFQQDVQATTYNPSSAFRYKSTTSKYEDVNETALRGESPDPSALEKFQYDDQGFEVFNRVSNRKFQTAQKLPEKNTTAAKRNDVADIPKLSFTNSQSNFRSIPQAQSPDSNKFNSELKYFNQSQLVQRSKGPSNRIIDRQHTEPQFFRSKPQDFPTPFTAPQAQQQLESQGTQQNGDSGRVKTETKQPGKQGAKYSDSNYGTQQNGDDGRTKTETKQSGNQGAKYSDFNYSRFGFPPKDGTRNKGSSSPVQSPKNKDNFSPEKRTAYVSSPNKVAVAKHENSQSPPSKEFELNPNSHNEPSKDKSKSRTSIANKTTNSQPRHQDSSRSSDKLIQRDSNRGQGGGRTTLHPHTVGTEVRPARNRGRINYKATTQGERYLDNSIISSTSGTKKFSTLVTKEQFYPTTFKPTTYFKKAFDQKPAKYLEPKIQESFSTSTVLATTPTPIQALSTPDENDGQYHPELYEVDYSWNNGPQTKKPPVRVDIPTPHSPQDHLQSQQKTSFQKQTGQQVSQQQHPFDNNKRKFLPPPTTVDPAGDDELIKPEYSLNLGAASLNKLRADTLKGSDKTLPQSSLNFDKSTIPSTTSPTTITPRRPSPSNQGVSKKPIGSAKRPAHADSDTSYDYAYYDTLSETPQEYTDYDVISEFRKTKKQ